MVEESRLEIEGVQAMVVATARDELVIGLLMMFIRARTFEVRLTVDGRGTVGAANFGEETLFSGSGCVVRLNCISVECSGRWLWNWEHGA